MTLDGGVRSILDSQWGILNNASWLPDGRIVFVGVEKKHINGTKKDLWVMDADGSAITCRSSSLVTGVGGQLHDDVPIYWNMGAASLLPSKDGSEVLTTVQIGGSVHIYRITTQGAEGCTCLVEGERTCFPMGRAGEKVLFGISTMFDPTQLAVADLDSHEEKILTHLNAPLLERITLPSLENI